MRNETIIAKSPLPLDMLFYQEVYRANSKGKLLKAINLRDSKKILKKIQLDQEILIEENTNIKEIVKHILIGQLSKQNTSEKTKNKKQENKKARQKAAEDLMTNFGIS